MPGACPNRVWPPALHQQLLRALAKLDSYLRAPLEHELAQDPQLPESRRRFLDGDQLTLADCGLLPKLHIVDVSTGRERDGGGDAAWGEALTGRVPADCVRTLPRGAHLRRAARGETLPGLRATGEGVQVHVSAQRRDPGRLPARRATPLAHARPLYKGSLPLMSVF